MRSRPFLAALTLGPLIRLATIPLPGNDDDVFVLNVGAHENHQLLEVPLFVLAAALAPRSPGSPPN